MNFRMDIKDKEQFVFWMQRALGSHADGSHADDNYIELYNILLRLTRTTRCSQKKQGLHVQWIIQVFLEQLIRRKKTYFLGFGTLC